MRLPEGGRRAYWRWGAGALALLAAAGYTAVGVYRDSRFGSNAFDLGNQMQTIWGYSQFQVIPNTVLGIRNLLGDHFHPILMLLGPLYRIWPSPDLLFAVQALLLAVAAIPVYLLAEEWLGPLAALALEAAYLLFWGVLDGVIYDFHHVAFAVPAVAWALYAVERRRDALLLAMVAVGMLTREDVALTLAGLGVYIAAAKRRPLLGLALAAVNAAWFAFLVVVALPALAGGAYRHWSYGALGPGPLSALKHVVLHPLSSARLLVAPFEKVKLLVGLAAAWLALPLLSPIVIVAIPGLLSRLWSSESTLWSLHYQYSMLIAPILAIAAADGLRRLRPWVRRPAAITAVALSVLVANIAITFAGVKPFAELPTYVSPGYAASVQACLDVIPPQASVAASNFLLPHLANRRQIYLFPAGGPVDYVAVDVATNRHFAPGEEAQLRLNVRRTLAAGYGVVCSRGLTLVLRRGAPPGTVAPPAARWLAGAPAAALAVR